MSDNRISRRDFIRHSAEVAGAAALTPTLLAADPVAPARTATDWVPLGKSGIKICRLGMGTGTKNGRTQRELGQEGFNRLVHYAYERGVRYIDTADNYQTHPFVREAIKGIPRESLFILSKMPWNEQNIKNPLATLDRYRKELGVDYIDALLIHCTTKPTWTGDLRSMMDGFDQAQAKGLIRVKGVSCHGLGALRCSTEADWPQVQLARINPQGHLVDGDNAANPHAPEGKVPEAMREIKAMHDKGRGIIGMKIIGEGAFTDAADREKSVHHAMNCGFVDAVTIGFKNTAEVDEAIERLNRALKA